MRVIFIVPTQGYGLIEGKEKKKKRIAGFFPSLGPAFLATVLENEGHKCKIIDMQGKQVTKEELVKEVKSFNPDAIGITILTPLAPEAFRISKIMKDALKIPIIVGGPHASLFPKEILQEHDAIDYVVHGEGEYKLLELVDAIENNKSKKGIRGIYYREKGKIIETAPALMIENLDNLPIPSRKFFDIKRYIPVANQYRRLPLTNMITSRGCTYARCKFCAESGRLHSKYRRNSVERVLEEVKYLVDDYKVREIAFWDDEFVLGRKWIDDFCNNLKKEKYDLTWSCYAKVNFVTRPILNNMASAGCWNIFYGIETGNQKLLNNIKKGQTLKQIRDAVKWTQQVGIEAKGSFMLGLPGETPELARKTINFACELDLDYANFCLTTPYPGTELYDEFIGAGNKTTDLSTYTCHVPIYLPEGYKNKKQLINLQKLAYRKFYFRPKYFKRRLKAIHSFEDINRYLQGIKFLVKAKVIKNSGL